MVQFVRRNMLWQQFNVTIDYNDMSQHISIGMIYKALLTVVTHLDQVRYNK